MSDYKNVRDRILKLMENNDPNLNNDLSNMKIQVDSIYL